jgi:putative hydrolase of the HAD superfamily
MKYKAIIFDLFGTLVDSYSVQGYNRLLTDMASALELPLGDFSKIWHDTTYERGTGIFKTTEESIRYICDILKVSIKDENIRKCEQIRRETTRKALTPKNRAVDILKTPSMWKNTEFSQLFDVTIFSASVGMKKPDPQIYNLACEQMGVESNECLYFGDGDSNELSGAAQFGMDAVMIRDPNELDPYRLVEVVWEGRKIENFSEIMDLI